MKPIGTRWSIVLRRSLRILMPAVAALLIGMIYFLGIYSERTGFVEQVLDPGFKRITQPVLNAFRGRPPQVLELNIQASGPYLDSLLAERERALEEGWLATGSTFRAPAIIERGMDSLIGSIALLPGPGDRFQGVRWPFHVVVENSDTILRMRSFILDPVMDAAPLHAWTFQQALRKMDLPAFGYTFTDLRFNDRDLGLYAAEGQVDSIVLGEWGRGPGPILRFDDHLFNNISRSMERRRYPSAMPMQGEWLSAPILSYRLQETVGNSRTLERERSAIRALEDLRAGRIGASHVFNTDELARLLALCDLLGAQETMSWWNVRFLPDSIPSKLAVVPLKGIAGVPIELPLALLNSNSRRHLTPPNDLTGRILSDDLVFNTYLAYLDTFSTEGWWEDLEVRLSEAHDEQLRIVRAEIPEMEYDPEVYLHNREVIRDMLHPKDLLLAYTQHDQRGGHRISLANVHALPIKVDRIVVNGDTLVVEPPKYLLPRDKDKPLNYAQLMIDRPIREGDVVELSVGLVGLDEPRFVKTRSWSMIPAN